MTGFFFFNFGKGEKSKGIRSKEKEKKKKMSALPLFDGKVFHFCSSAGANQELSAALVSTGRGSETRTIAIAYLHNTTFDVCLRAPAPTTDWAHPLSPTAI